MKSNKPLIVIETKLLPKSVGGFTLGTIVFIKKDVHHYKAILEHEKVHVRQFREDWFMPLKYIFSAEKRLEYALEAYAESCRHGYTVSEAVNALYRLYDFGLPTFKLKELLLKELEK